MKRGILLAAAVVAMGMFTVVASAQPQRRGGNRGGRPGGMQRGGGMMRGIGVAQLLRSPDVQKEIKLTDDEKTQLQAAMAAGRPQFDRQAMQDLSQEERRAKM